MTARASSAFSGGAFEDGGSSMSKHGFLRAELSSSKN